MPLNQAGPRELIHRRSIVCEGFRRADGLWEMEGCLVDTKSYDFGNRARTTVRAGEPVHEMRMRVALDDSFVIREVEVASDFFPYPNCGDIAPAYRALVGMRVAPGMTRKLRELFGGTRGCTHLTRLLDNLMQTAIQTMAPLKGMEESQAPGRKPPHLDGCHALSTLGPVVKEHYPQWYRSEE